MIELTDKDLEAMSPIQITNFTMPDDYRDRWNCGDGDFWMICTEREGNFERWIGVDNTSKLLANIDIDPIKRQAFSNGKGMQRVIIAKTFVKNYGGKMLFQGKEIGV